MSHSGRGQHRAANNSRKSRPFMVGVFLILAVIAVYLLISNFLASGGKAISTATTTSSIAKPRSITTTSTSSTTTTQVFSGPYGVGVSSYTLTEPGKYLCAPHGTDSGCVVRSMPLEVSYPTLGPAGSQVQGAAPYSGAGPYPLIIFGNGYLEPAGAYSLLIDYWVSRGYVVAAPQFPLSQTNSVGGPYEADILNQPGDMAAAIKFMKRENTMSASRMKDLINTSAIALIGQSDGGDAALAAGYNTCCQIPGIRAVVSLSGAELPSYPGKYFTTGGPSLLVVQGTEDEINPPAQSEMAYDQADVTKFYLSLLGADHLNAYVQANQYSSVVENVTTEFLNRYLKNVSGSISLMHTNGNIPGVASLS